MNKLQLFLLGTLIISAYKIIFEGCKVILILIFSIKLVINEIKLKYYNKDLNQIEEEKEMINRTQECMICLEKIDLSRTRDNIRLKCHTT